MTYKKSLKHFQKLKGEDRRAPLGREIFLLTHSFHAGKRIVAEATSKGCVYARGIGVGGPEDMEQDRSK